MLGRVEILKGQGKIFESVIASIWEDICTVISVFEFLKKRNLFSSSIERRVPL